MSKPVRLPKDVAQQVKSVIRSSLLEGEENRISRRELLMEINQYFRGMGRFDEQIDDRAMRAMIEELRISDTIGAFICASSRSGGGYYLARNKKELEAKLNPDRSRAATTWKRITRQMQIAGIEAQMPLPDPQEGMELKYGDA